MSGTAARQGRADDPADFPTERAHQLKRRIAWGFLIAPLLGVIAAFATVQLLGRIWRDCEMSRSPVAGYQLVFTGIGVFVASAVLAWFAYLLVCLIPIRKISALAFAVAVCAAGTVVQSTVSSQRSPEGVKASRCVDGVPPWWPTWFPL